MSQLNLKPASNYLPPVHTASKGVLQRKCGCGNHSSGGQCEECNKKKIQRKLNVGASNDPLELEADRVADQVVAGSAVSPVSSFRAPLVQRDGPADPKTEEEKYKEGGKKVLEAFLETSVGKQLTEDAKKAMFDTWKGRIITGSIAAGTITALAAAEKELPVQLPEIPLDFLTPGLSVKFEYNGPVNKPTGAALTFIFKEQGPANKKPVDKFPELAPIRQAEKMFPRPQPTGGPDQKFWDQYQLQELQKRLPSLKPNPQQAPEKKSPLQLTPPKFGSGIGYKPPSLFGDEFKLKLDGDKKKKDDDKIQKKTRVGSSNDPLETEADAVADRVLSNSAAPVPVTSASTAIQRAQADSESSAPDSVDQTVAGSGKPLDSNTREFMESRFGQNFSQVRIHQGSSAEKSAKDVNAHAYTLGNNIVFGAGQFNPHSQTGKCLLAHELTHVLQQSGAAQQVQRETNEDSQNDHTEVVELEGDHLEDDDENLVAQADKKTPGKKTKAKDNSKKKDTNKKKDTTKKKDSKKAKEKETPNPCTRTIFAEGTCEFLVKNASGRCCDPDNGIENKERSVDVEKQPCPSNKFTPMFTCDNNCKNAKAKGCDDNDNWMAVPRNQFAKAGCGTVWTICANGKSTTGYVRDKSETEERFEVSPGIQKALGVKVGSSFKGSVYIPGAKQTAIDKDACCKAPAPAAKVS